MSLPEAWQFGVEPDQLAQLVVAGIKTATASGYRLYEAAGEPLPQKELSIILNGQDQPVCVIRVNEVRVLPYNEVTAELAYLEGEGDRSLAYWRQAHEAFFRAEYPLYGLEFQADELVVFELFECLYPKEVSYADDSVDSAPR